MIGDESGNLLLQQSIPKLAIRKPVRECMREGNVIDARSLKCMQGEP